MNELNFLKKTKFFIKLCEIFPVFDQKTVPFFFSFRPEMKRGGTFKKIAIVRSLKYVNPKNDALEIFTILNEKNAKQIKTDTVIAVSVIERICMF